MTTYTLKFSSCVHAFSNRILTFMSSVLMFTSYIHTFSNRVLTFMSSIHAVTSRFHTVTSRFHTFTSRVLTFTSRVQTFSPRVLTFTSRVQRSYPEFTLSSPEFSRFHLVLTLSQPLVSLAAKLVEQPFFLLATFRQKLKCNEKNRFLFYFGSLQSPEVIKKG
jgi:hypothetical protein